MVCIKVFQFIVDFRVNEVMGRSEFYGTVFQPVTLVIIADQHFMICRRAGQTSRSKACEYYNEYHETHHGAAERGCDQDMWDLIIHDPIPEPHLLYIRLHFRLWLLIGINWSLPLFADWLYTWSWLPSLLIHIVQEL